MQSLKEHKKKLFEFNYGRYYLVFDFEPRNKRDSITNYYNGVTGDNYIYNYILKYCIMDSLNIYICIELKYYRKKCTYITNSVSK